MIIVLGCGEYSETIPEEGIKHCNYVKGLVEASDENTDASIDLPPNIGNEKNVHFACDFLKQHASDEPVSEDWAKQPKRELTEWDKTVLAQFHGIELANLLKVANFLGSQLMLIVVSTHVADIIKNKSMAELQEYFGVFYEPTDEEVKEFIEMNPAFA